MFSFFLLPSHRLYQQKRRSVERKPGDCPSHCCIFPLKKGSCPEISVVHLLVIYHPALWNKYWINIKILKKSGAASLGLVGPAIIIWAKKAIQFCCIMPLISTKLASWAVPSYLGSCLLFGEEWQMKLGETTSSHPNSGLPEQLGCRNIGLRN